jgi:hypothetical protein
MTTNESYDEFYKQNLYKEVTGKQLNAQNIKFYKFIDNEYCYDGIKYNLGENIDPVEFNSFNEYLKEGIYFITYEHILEFSNYGNYFCEIEVDDDSRCFIKNNKIKANKINVITIIHINDIIDIIDHELYSNIIKQYHDNLYATKKKINLRVTKKKIKITYLRDIKQNGNMLYFFYLFYVNQM